MNQTRRSFSKLGVVLSGALLATLVFAAPVVFREQAEEFSIYRPAIPIGAAAPLAPEVPDVSTSAGTTVLQIQNKEAVTGTVFVTFYNTNGSAIDLSAYISGTSGLTNVIGSRGALILDYARVPLGTLPAGSRGSSVVSSDVDVAVVSTNVYTPNLAATSLIGLSSGSSVVSVANLTRKFQSQIDSSLYIQNTDAVTRSAKVEFFIDGSGSVIASQFITVPAFSGLEMDLGGTDPFFTAPAFNPGGIGYKGAAKITATNGGSFVAAADIRRNAGGLGATNLPNQFVHASNGFGQEQLATKFYAPLVRKNFLVPPNTQGFNTTIQMANPNNVTATVVITLNVTLPATNTGSAVVTVQIGPNNTYFYNQASPVPAPSGAASAWFWAGAATISSDQPIAAQVRDSKTLGGTGRGTSTAYNAFSDAQASNVLFAPQVRNAVGTSQGRTNIRIQNVGTGAVYLRVEYSSAPGSPGLTAGQSFDCSTTTVNAGESLNFVQFSLFRKDNVTTLPAGFNGTARISAVTSSCGTTLDGGAKLIATINESSPEAVALGSQTDAGLYESVK